MLYKLYSKCIFVHNSRPNKQWHSHLCSVAMEKYAKDRDYTVIMWCIVKALQNILRFIKAYQQMKKSNKHE